MDKTAFVFPGQGAQRVGMGLDLLKRWPKLADTHYRPADELLGFGLSQLCWTGPAEALRHMTVTQPAMVLTSLAALSVLEERGVVPDFVSGHSLGEFTAMVCAGVLRRADALRLVTLRGKLMASVTEKVPGKMAAVVGLDLAAVESLCAKAAAESGQVVEVANHNDFTQVVISGQTAAVDILLGLVAAAGADRVVVLEIGGAAHCTLLGSVEDEFAAALAEVEFRDPVIPVISSVTAGPVADGDEARACLLRQLTGRVNWTDTVRYLTSAGVRQFVEVGPGKALGGLCRRISPGVETYRTGDAAHLELAVEAFHRSRRTV
ncbi:MULTISPECIES: ACP S-malonyltransferase [unclassified Streptomyces]|uniref:ACP S-malonyltransferase n=1 Tax=unclassified Streptomyces TaxID=2593676 RepID=UPI002E15BFC0|nr:ACP S-malonyltransferase [Streptomyces sp. NBC_01197]WSS50051.1 ACP S-malonyltransferase [Streptomyces sp. NBC_01180]